MQFATEVRSVTEACSNSILPGVALKTPGELAHIVSQFASSSGWMDRVRLCIERRWYERLYYGPDHDIWVISWMPGQSTGFHDHGESAGAFLVATGVLEEHRPSEQAIVIHPDWPRAFGANYVHDVRNVSLAPAVSIHAYSPPLNEMNEYEMDRTGLLLRERTPEQAATPERKPQGHEWITAIRTSSVEEMLSKARAQLKRLSPCDAFEAATKTDAVLVDIRPEGQRAKEGSIPRALIVERNVLEWRFDPASSARLPIATSHHLQAIVFCSEGYTSSLAAAALQDLGLWRATDIVGGFQAWRAAGLPTTASTDVLKGAEAPSEDIERAATLYRI